MKFTIEQNRGGMSGPNGIVKRDGRYVAILYEDAERSEDFDALEALITTPSPVALIHDMATLLASEGLTGETWERATAWLELHRVDAMTHWQPIETAPRDKPILVWFDHDADPYCAEDGKLTDYACHAECGYFLSGKGAAIAMWREGWHENDGWEAGDEYWMPACWLFQINGDNSDYVCNPTHWMPLPEAPF